MQSVPINSTHRVPAAGDKCQTVYMFPGHHNLSSLSYSNVTQQLTIPSSSRGYRVCGRINKWSIFPQYAGKHGSGTGWNWPACSFHHVLRRPWGEQITHLTWQEETLLYMTAGGRKKERNGKKQWEKETMRWWESLFTTLRIRWTEAWAQEEDEKEMPEW